MTEIARDVVIVGAGSAGLTAANDLRMAGLSVAVLDAHDRISEALDERAHLLAERLGEDVLLGRPVHALNWSTTPSVIAAAEGLTVHARFGILAHQPASGPAAITVEPAVTAFPASAPPDLDRVPGRTSSTAPIHFAPSDDLARMAASAIIETIRS